jgi:hypothetical protein
VLALFWLHRKAAAEEKAKKNGNEEGRVREIMEDDSDSELEREVDEDPLHAPARNGTSERTPLLVEGPWVEERARRERERERARREREGEREREGDGVREG